MRCGGSGKRALPASITIGQAVEAVFDGVHWAIDAFFDWLDDATGGKLSPVLDFIRDMFHGMLETVQGAFNVAITFIRDLFSGLVQFFMGFFLSDCANMANGFGNILRSMLNLAIDAINWMIQSVVDGVNSLIRLVNSLGSVLGVNFNEITPPQFDRVPMLAQGAVIPPNAPFMAMLGDQSHGNNIEAPEELIRKIVREESGSGDSAMWWQMLRLLEEIRDRSGTWLDGKKLTDTVTRYQRMEARALGR